MKIIKKNTWENHKIDVEIKVKNQFPNTHFFFDFSNSLKRIKIKLCSPKTLRKLLTKPLRKIEILALKNLIKNNPRDGLI